MPHKKLVAFASWDIGVKEKTLNEYLQALQDLGKVEWDAKAKVWKASE